MQVIGKITMVINVTMQKGVAIMLISNIKTPKKIYFSIYFMFSIS